MDTSFLTLKKVHLNQKSKSLVEYITKSSSIRVLLCSIFDHCLKNLFLSVLFLIVSIIIFYYLVKNCGSRLQKNMKRRGGKREGAGRKKSPALAKITREINQKQWRANHHYIYLENRVFSTRRKIRAKGTFANDSNFAS